MSPAYRAEDLDPGLRARVIASYNRLGSVRAAAKERRIGWATAARILNAAGLVESIEKRHATKPCTNCGRERRVNTSRASSGKCSDCLVASRDAARAEEFDKNPPVIEWVNDGGIMRHVYVDDGPHKDNAYPLRMRRTVA